MKSKNNINNLYCFLALLLLNNKSLNAIKVQSLENIAVLAISNNLEAQTELGTRYMVSSKHDKDIRSAYKKEMLGLHWYLKAGEKGFAKAQFLLASFYLMDAIKSYGKSPIPSNRFSISFMWLQRSAIQGYPDAQFNMGIFKEFGAGTISNIKDATKWYAKYIQHNNPAVLCPICIEPLLSEVQKDLTGEVHCKNVFHMECLDEWKAANIDKSNPTPCPLCRTLLTSP